LVFVELIPCRFTFLRALIIFVIGDRKGRVFWGCRVYLRGAMRGKSMVIDFRGGGIIDLDCMRRRGGGGGRRGSPGGLRLRVVMASLVDNLGNLAIQRPLHLLLGRASRMSALVIAPGVFAPLHLLLAVFPPVVAIVRSPLLSHGLSLRLKIIVIGSVIGVGLEWIEFGFHHALVRRTGTILFDGAPGQLLLLLLLLQLQLQNSDDNS